MKKAEIIKANSALMIAIMFIDLDPTTKQGHPRSQHVRKKIHKILENYNNQKNKVLNIRANALAEKTLTAIQGKIEGAVDVNVVAMCLLSNLEDVINLPKVYSMPTSDIVE